MPAAQISQGSMHHIKIRDKQGLDLEQVMGYWSRNSRLRRLGTFGPGLFQAWIHLHLGPVSGCMDPYPAWSPYVPRSSGPGPMLAQLGMKLWPNKGNRRRLHCGCASVFQRFLIFVLLDWPWLVRTRTCPPGLALASPDVTKFLLFIKFHMLWIQE